MNITKLFNWSFTDDAHGISISATAFQSSNGNVQYSVSRLNTMIDLPWTVIKCGSASDALSLARRYLDVDRKVLLAYLA